MKNVPSFYYQLPNKRGEFGAGITGVGGLFFDNFHSNVVFH